MNFCQMSMHTYSKFRPVVNPATVSSHKVKNHAVNKDRLKIGKERVHTFKSIKIFKFI